MQTDTPTVFEGMSGRSFGDAHHQEGFPSVDYTSGLVRTLPAYSQFPGWQSMRRSIGGLESNFGVMPLYRHELIALWRSLTATLGTNTL